jgi:Leucine-rich repeat (LRR) protein
MPQIKITTSDGIEESVNTDDIQTYLNGLPENITKINVRQCNLTSISNLSRFINLIYLYCNENKLTSLPELPVSLQNLYCSNNQLTSLPFLPTSLKNLDCDNNQLKSLPKLPESLGWLYCNNNHLTFLPLLPKEMWSLSSYSNQLSSLPELPESLWYLDCYNNPIFDILYVLSVIYEENNELSLTKCRNAINTLNRFRYLYYYLRFKIMF